MGEPGRSAGGLLRPATAAAYQQAPAYQQPAEDPTEARLAKLQSLAELKAQGVLTEAEFQQQKAAILNS